MDLISGRDKTSGEDDIFRSPRDPSDHLIQTFNRWETETVPRDTLCYGWALCAEAAAVGHGLWLQLVVGRGGGWPLSLLSALDPQSQPEADSTLGHQHLLKARAFPRWVFCLGLPGERRRWCGRCCHCFSSDSHSHSPGACGCHARQVPSAVPPPPPKPLLGCSSANPLHLLLSSIGFACSQKSGKSLLCWRLSCFLCCFGRSW